jgi:hypothetical protein
MNERIPKRIPRNILLAGVLATGIGAVNVENTAASSLPPVSPIERVSEQGCPPYLNPYLPGAYELNLITFGCLIGEAGQINAINQAIYGNALSEAYINGIRGEHFVRQQRRELREQQRELRELQREQRNSTHHGGNQNNHPRGHEHWQR